MPATRARRILLMLSSQGGGGAERVVSHLAAAWVEEGREVHLLLTHAGGRQESYPLPLEVAIHPLAPEVHGRSPLQQLRRLRLLRRHIRDLRPDVVLAFLTNVNVAAVLGTRGLGIPVVVSERIYPPLFPVAPWLHRMRRLAYPRADRVVVQSEAAAQWVGEHCPGARVCVLPNPLVLPLAAGPGVLDPCRWVADDERLLLACGRLDGQKSFDVLLDAWSLLGAATEGWRLVILGEGAERGALEARARRLGIMRRVALPGWAGNPAEWYARADLFVLCSRYEGFPNVLLEAMAYGLCCVSSDCPTGPGELIVDGSNGVLVPMPAPAEAFAQALAPLLASPAERQALGRRARERAADFAAARVVPRWSKLLDEIAVAGHGS